MQNRPKNRPFDSDHFDDVNLHSLDESNFSDELDSQDDSDDGDSFNDVVQDIDFSQFKGEFKHSLRSIDKAIVHKRKVKKKRVKKPLTKAFEVEHGKRVLHGRGGRQKTISKIFVPNNKKVIVEGVDSFIMNHTADNDSVRNIGYYKGEKLKELIITFNNDSAVDFNLELFNPSMPLDYLQSTSLNINDKVQIAGGDAVAYTDLLFNLLANPAFIANAKFTFSSTNLAEQVKEALFFKNKSIEGKQRIKPLQLPLQMDTMQVAQDIVFFDIIGNLGRPFIPDGMDVIQYRVLAGSTVTFGFYYKQKDLKKFFYKEAANSKLLL